jgi:hypothetical protein
VHIGKRPLALTLSVLFASSFTGCVGRFERPSIPPVIAVPSPDKTGNYTLANYADDLKSYAAATGDAATALRNKMVYSVLAEIDYVFYDYETKLFSMRDGLMLLLIFCNSEWRLAAR